MKRLFKFFIAISLILNMISFSGLAQTNLVSSNDNWVEFEEKNGVSLKKEWTIRFSAEVTKEKISSIEIEKENKSIDIEHKIVDKDKIVITPSKLYEVNSKYCINIVLSNGNKYKMYFDTILKEEGKYTSKEEVSLYLNTYNKLPSNYINKKDAIALGWVSTKGNLWDVTDEKSIGGDYFGNREKVLPTKSGRTYSECDINYKGGYRGEERLVYSNDGLIYYTADHYDTFTLLYGEE